jgi:hypothetical protein
MGVSAGSHWNGGEVIPPPNGVLGCGASIIAIPGVNICPSIICCAFNPLVNKENRCMLNRSNFIIGSWKEIQRKQTEQHEVKVRKADRQMNEGMFNSA